MSKTEKLRLAYTIFLSVFVVAVGIATICVAADIYYSGGSAHPYTRELVGDRLLKLTIPFILLIAAIIMGAALLPAFDARVKTNSATAVEMLMPRLPVGAKSGSESEYAAARAKYKKTWIIRLVIWLVAVCFALAAAIVELCYLVNTAHFQGELTACILEMTKWVMSWTAAAFFVLVAAAVANSFLAKRQLSEVKSLIKLGDGSRVGTPKWADAITRVLDSNITQWVVRGVIIAVAIVFIVLGILNGGASAMLTKAINLCKECVGIG